MNSFNNKTYCDVNHDDNEYDDNDDDAYDNHLNDHVEGGGDD
jgi:hypothetical protein